MKWTKKKLNKFSILLLVSFFRRYLLFAFIIQFTLIIIPALAPFDARKIIFFFSFFLFFFFYYFLFVHGRKTCFTLSQGRRGRFSYGDFKSTITPLVFFLSPKFNMHEISLQFQSRFTWWLGHVFLFEPHAHFNSMLLLAGTIRNWKNIHQNL